MKLKDFYSNFILWLDNVEKTQKEEYQILIENARHEFINGWGINLHHTEAQRMRFKRAVYPDEVSRHGYLNKYSFSTSFIGTKDRNTRYKTTLKTCTCPDFNDRHKPCKHMYKLAILLDVISEDFLL